MQVSKTGVAGVFLLCMSSCIEPFQPEITETKELLVINGKISDQPGWNYVEVSRSSPLYEPEFIPEQGCVVRVEDDNGEGFTYSEFRPGVYRVELDKPFLGVDKAYKIFVFTPDGEEYQSDYDPLLACPPIGNLYYLKEKQETEDKNITYYGLQFYVDVRGEAGDSRNFLWKLEETYEYHSLDNFQFSWKDLVLQYFDPPSDSITICYTTLQVPELFTASSMHLTSNELRGYPLNYVSNQSPRLGIAYGLRVKQYSLSDDAFLYWDKLRSQLSETAGLYAKQPSGSQGNIYNVHDVEEQVLGYFHSSQVKEKWVLFKNKNDFSARIFLPSCDTIDNWPDELPEPIPNPSYLISIDSIEDVEGPPFLTGVRCLNCLDWGGNLNPPDYWFEDE